MTERELSREQLKKAHVAYMTAYHNVESTVDNPVLWGLKAAAPHLQYQPEPPQEQPMFYDKTDEYDMRTPPAESDAELVREMVDVWCNTVGKFDDIVEDHRIRMTADLAVARAAIEQECVAKYLAEPTKEELVNTWNECAKWPKDRTDWEYLVKHLIASRRTHKQADPLADLLWSISGEKEDYEHNEAVREAYRRGRDAARGDSR